MAESPEKHYVFAAVFTIFPAIFVVLRFWARRIKRVRILSDDWTILLALIGCITTAILLVIDTAGGGLGKRLERNERGEVIYNERFWIHMKASFGNRLSQLFAIGPTKISVLLFYRRVFAKSHPRFFDTASWTLIIISYTWMMGFFFSNIFEYHPLSVIWTVIPEETPQPNIPMYLSQCYIDIATDVLIISLPIPIILRLSWSWKKKIGICCVFGMGIITTAASIARTVINIQTAKAAERGDPDFDTYYLAAITYWTLIEAGLGIIAGNLPLLGPVAKVVVKGLGSCTSRDTGSTSALHPREQNSDEPVFFVFGSESGNTTAPEKTSSSAWLPVYHGS